MVERSLSEITDKISIKDTQLNESRVLFFSLIEKARKDSHIPREIAVTEYTHIAPLALPDPVYRRIKKCQQKIHRATNQRKRLMQDARKIDTREKIQLGGLVVKAGLRDAEKALILGALVELKDSLEKGDAGRIKALTELGLSLIHI